MKLLYLLSIFFMQTSKAQDSTKIPPMVTAGLDQVVFYPTNNVILRGAGQGVDSKIKSYCWEQLSPCNKARIVSPDSVITFAVGLEVGYHYIFQLTATDKIGNSSKDTVTITVTK